ncbi:MAG: MobA/MobL family protein, partial [Gammaproteobacteria bacterium]
MAIYSVQVKSLSRGKGDSATAAAAYRAGLSLDDPSGTRHDYSKKTGVLAVDMLAPKDAPTWALDPHQVWARVEEHETRKNARVAREVLIALPHELDPAQRRELARNVGQLLVDRYGVVAQVALHAPDRGGDDRNYHAHILLTPRVVGVEGFGDSAAKVLDEYKAGAQELKDLRAAVGERINTALAGAGVSARVDHRSLIDQKAEAVAKSDFAQVVALD